MTTSYTGVNIGSGDDASLIAFEYYDRKFLRYAVPKLAWYQFGQKRPLPMGEGDSITFSRYTPFGRVSTPLTRGVNPDGQSLTAGTLTAGIDEWGGVVPISSYLDLTSIDPKVSETSGLLGVQAGETLDWVIQARTLTAGTVTAKNIYPAGENFGTATPITSVLDTSLIRQAVFRLKIAKAIMFEGAYWVCIISPHAEFDITGSTDWVEASKYAGSKQLFEGEIGRWFGVRFVEDTNPLTFAANNGVSAGSTLPGVCGSTGALVPTVVFGQESYGVSELTGRKIIIKIPGPQDTSNPLNMWKTVGWKQTFGNRFLNENWIRPIWTAATLSGAA